MDLFADLQHFRVRTDYGAILECRPSIPMIYVGHGEEKVDMYRGNFQIEDYLTERVPVFIKEVTKHGSSFSINFDDKVVMTADAKEDSLILKFEPMDPEINRFWLRIISDAEEHCYGCGEQMSYFNLKGRHFPLWTSEPGVGRDKSTYVTWRSDVENKAGGDYYNTNFPQGAFLSSRHYYLYAEATAYSDFDFRHPEYHELQFWEVPSFIRIQTADSFLTLMEKQSAFFGRQPELPDWVYNGLIIGLQGGWERVSQLLKKTLENKIKVSGLWCQDWAGSRMTSFGKRNHWDWHYSNEKYPDLPKIIKALHLQGIRFLGYISPYLVDDGELFSEGIANNAFALKADGTTYLVDFGEFQCGVIDLTNPAAYNWFKDRVIKECSLNIGIDGWMADFGEYLPTDDIVLHSGRSPMLEHNRWPALWAKCNYDAVAENGQLGNVVYFMRAGAKGSQKHALMLWAGDQCVDFSRHDGLCTVICAALSAGISGCGLHHSDIGGYTSLFGNKRTKEVFLRWAEMAAFTPMMRTHESNRPDENFQYYNDEDCMRQLARLVEIFIMLAPYTKSVVKENADRGIPVQRPMFFHDESDPNLYDLQFQYMYGPDVVVAPVCKASQSEWSLYLPKGQWKHLWTNQLYGRGMVTVPAPLGCPPVFYRTDSVWSDLFDSIYRKYSLK